MTIATYILFLSEYFPEEIFPKILTVITVSVSVLMVSTIRYDVMPAFTFRGGPLKAIYFIVVILMGLSAMAFPKILLFPYILIYIVSGLGRFIFRLGQGKGLRKKK